MFRFSALCRFSLYSYVPIICVSLRCCRLCCFISFLPFVPPFTFCHLRSCSCPSVKQQHRWRFRRSNQSSLWSFVWPGAQLIFPYFASHSPYLLVFAWFRITVFATCQIKATETTEQRKREKEEGTIYSYIDKWVVLCNKISYQGGLLQCNWYI